MTKKMRSGVLLAVLAVLFLGMFAVFGPGVYNDSDQYMKMHIHREPIYPLFLAALRAMFGEGYLTAMGIIQNLLAAVSIWLFAEYISKRFSLYLWEELIVIILGLMPHMITKYFSSLHLFMTNSVMSEAVCLPLFTIFILQCVKIMVEEDKKSVRRAAWSALLLGLLLSLTRSQMMLALLMWAVVIGAKVMVTYLRAERAERKRFWLSLAVVILITVLAFSVRTLAVKSYNLVFNGHFINNTYGTVNTLTNILYAADREDGANIEDEEAREFFYRMYDLTEERQANYKYAGDTWREKVEHIEKWHDTVKYEMIEDVFYQTYDKKVTSDYIMQNLMADEVAGKIIAGVLPGCFGRWLGNCLLIAGYGLIRSIAVVHPIINRLALFIYISAIALTIFSIRSSIKKKEKINNTVWLMGIALLAVIANAFAVALTIMALSRYMIYGFATFYTAYFMLVIMWVRSCGKDNYKFLNKV